MSASTEEDSFRGYWIESGPNLGFLIFGMRVIH